VPAPGDFEASHEPVELRPASDDEMDFVDPHDDDPDERERSDRPAADPPPRPHSP
jgi:hypothetical protein